MSDLRVRPTPARPRVHRWIRFGLVLMVAGWAVVFFIATQLDPYDNGQPRRMETHRQLGLPPCTFKDMTGLPCPSCGMTTSFALLIRGDVWNSLRANFVGTGLAAFGLLFIPWALASAAVGRLVLVRSLETLLFQLCMAFLVLLFGRWGLTVLLVYLGGP